MAADSRASCSLMAGKMPGNLAESMDFPVPGGPDISILCTIKYSLNNNKAAMRKAYSYIRMSSDRQLRGDSLRRQLELSEKYAAANNLQIVDHIDGIPLKDIGVSGYKGVNSSTGVLAIFLKALGEGQIESGSVLMVESLDRLSRDNLANALSQFLSIINSGIEVVTLADQQVYTKDILNVNPSAIYLSLGIMFRANEESLTKARRLSSSWANKRLNASSKPLTRICPAWLEYSEAEKKFVVNKDKAKVVEQIFSMCADTCGIYAIAKHLNDRKIPTFGKSKFWQRSYVKKILQNRAVLGEFQPHQIIDGFKIPAGEVIKSYYPKVCDETLFLRAQASITRRTTSSSSGRKGNAYSNLFSGLLYCGICGSSIAYKNRGSTSKGGKYLVCSGATVKSGCKMPEWNYNVVQDLIFQHLKELDFNELLGNQEEITSVRNELEALYSKRTILEKKINDAIQLNVGEGLNSITRARLTDLLNNLESDFSKLTNEISALELIILELNTQHEGLKSEHLKATIEKIHQKNDDYLFRSSLNQLLSKSIKHICFSVEATQLEEWELDEDDEIVQGYRRDYPDKSGLPLSPMITASHFKNYQRDFGKRLTVVYRNGATRTIFYRYNYSLFTRNIDHIRAN